MDAFTLPLQGRVKYNPPIGGDAMPESYPLPSSNPEALGFALKPLEHLDRLIREHIEQGRYPGAQIALARNGQLTLFRTYGDAKTEPRKVPATGDTLFLLFSQTKVLTSSAAKAGIASGRPLARWKWSLID